MFALLVFVVFLSAGFRSVFADDSGSGEDVSVGDVSSEAEYADKTETQMDTEKASEVDTGAAPKASGKLEARFHEVELVDSVPEMMDRKETDAEGVPDIPETNPSEERTRSGNLDAYYGKSKWCSNKSKNVWVCRD